MKYFEDSNTQAVHLCALADSICSMVAAGFTNAPPSSPTVMEGKDLCEVQVCFDNLWWDIHDHLEDETSHIRRKLDAVGIQAIDEVTFEELEAASLESGNLKSLVELPKRALDKIAKGGAPEPKFSTAVDVLK